MSALLIGVSAVAVANLITLRLPLRLVSEANRRGAWFVHDRRRKQQRTVTRCVANLVHPSLRPATGSRLVVTITRVAPRALDTDNLATSAKAVRDELAAWLGVSDGPKGPVDWRYAQRREGKVYGTLVEVTW